MYPPVVPGKKLMFPSMLDSEDAIEQCQACRHQTMTLTSLDLDLEVPNPSLSFSDEPSKCA